MQKDRRGLALVTFLWTNKYVDNWFDVVALSVLNASIFFITLVTRIEALKIVDINFYFPFNKIGSLLILVLFSYFVLGEQSSPIQLVGIVVAICAVFALSFPEGSDLHKPSEKKAYVLTFISTIFMAFAFITADFAMDRVGLYVFTIVTYLCTLLFSFILTMFQKRENPASDATVYSTPFALVKLGIVIGIANFLGLIFYLAAVKRGNLSLVGAINNLSLLVTLVLPFIVAGYKETIGVRRGVGISLAFVSLFLLR